MKFKQFGNIGENVFVIGLGTYGFGDAYGGISKEDSFQILNDIVRKIPKDANLLVDTAPHYGEGICEKWIGEFLNKSSGNNILIATKGGRHIDHNRINEKDFSYEFLKADLGNSLERLGGNKIFLYQLHNPSLDIITEGSVFDLLEEFREQKKIKYYGISIDDPEEGIAAINTCKRKNYSGLVSIQVIYNILNKSASDKLFRIAKESNIAIIAREPLFRGFLTDKYSEGNRFSYIPPARQKEIDSHGLLQIQQKVSNVKKLLQRYHVVEPLSKVAIKFSISHPNVTLTIPGTNRQEYVEPNLDSANISLDSDLLSELNSIEDIASPHEPEVSTKDLPVNAENSNRDAIGMVS